MSMILKMIASVLLFGLTLAFGVTAFVAAYWSLRHGESVLGHAGLFLLLSIGWGGLFTLLAQNLAAGDKEVVMLNAEEVFAPLN